MSKHSVHFVPHLPVVNAPLPTNRTLVERPPDRPWRPSPAQGPGLLDFQPYVPGCESSSCAEPRSDRLWNPNRESISCIYHGRLVLHPTLHRRSIIS